MEVLESGVSQWVAGHSPLGLLCIAASCVSGFQEGCRRIGEFGGEIGLVACRFQWMWVDIHF